MAPTTFFHIFSVYFFNYLIKNPQTTSALTFLTHNISAIDGGFKAIYLQPKNYIPNFGVLIVTGSEGSKFGEKLMTSFMNGSKI